MAVVVERAVVARGGTGLHCCHVEVAAPGLVASSHSLARWLSARSLSLSPLVSAPSASSLFFLCPSPSVLSVSLHLHLSLCPSLNSHSQVN